MKSFKLAIATAALLLGAGAQAQTTTLKLGHALPTNSTRHLAAMKFAEDVSKKTAGRVAIQVMPNAEAGDDAVMLKNVRGGTLDITVSNQGLLAKEVPEYAALGMPFLFDSLPKAWKVLDGPIGKELIDKSLAKGLVVLALWDNGIRQISNNVRPVLKPEDMKGLKIRTPADSVTVDIMTALGATVQQLKFTEVHGALEAGVMDGQENPIATIESAKLYEVQKYLSLTGHKYESTPVIMLPSTLQKLSEADRKALQEAAAESLTLQRKLTNEADDKAIAVLKAKGMKIDKVDSAAFLKATAGVTDKWLASDIGPFVKKVVAAAK